MGSRRPIQAQTGGFRLTQAWRGPYRIDCGEDNSTQLGGPER